MVVTLKPSEATGSLHITIQLKGRPPLLSTLIPLLKNTIHSQLILKTSHIYSLSTSELTAVSKRESKFKRVFCAHNASQLWRPTWGSLVFRLRELGRVYQPQSRLKAFLYQLNKTFSSQIVSPTRPNAPFLCIVNHQVVYANHHLCIRYEKD